MLDNTAATQQPKKRVSRLLLIILALAIIAFASVFTFALKIPGNLSKIDNFEECEAAGFPIMESYPEQCRTSDGRVFTKIYPPQEFVAPFGQQITLQTGQTARFPDGSKVTLGAIYDSRCKTGTTCIWAGELSPKFIADNQEFTMGTTTKKEVRAGMYFFVLQNATENTAVITVSKDAVGQCIITGCSGQLCSDREVTTTCEYKPEYACYKSAKCERQSNGQCGWTLSADAVVCLETL